MSCRSRRAHGPQFQCLSPSALDPRPLVLDCKDPSGEPRRLDRLVRIDRVPVHITARPLRSPGARVALAPPFTRSLDPDADIVPPAVPPPARGDLQPVAAAPGPDHP